MKFIKKPIVIDAEKCTEKTIIRNVGWPDMVANPGDWIITEISGERYSCKPDFFKANYQTLEDMEVE
jgi:hypothetical protein